jgi:LysR family transcriptional regulator, low CO2-responsive transcriptional regulator
MTNFDEPIDARRLRAFSLLAREASFAAAAATLSLTPSAMSHSIKVLEEEMGGALFDRRGHRAVLTSLGERLLPHAERILRQMRSARQEMQTMQQWGRGTLRIAAPASACQYFLPAVLLEFRECFPDCALNITALDTEAAMKLVDEGRLDLAICVRAESLDSLEWHALFEDSLHFYVSPMHPWATAKKLARRDIAKEQVIVYDRSAVTAKLIMAKLKKLGVQPADVLSLGSMEAIKEMVKVGIGIGVLAPWVTVRETDAGSLVKVPFPIETMKREWGVVTYSGQRLSFMAETFLGLCREITMESVY